MWSISWFDRTLAYVLPTVGRVRRRSSAKISRMLGVHFRPAAESIADCAASLVAHGCVKPRERHRGTKLAAIGGAALLAAVILGVVAGRRK